jgi:glycosyltransferase involved in cell wall biosynthesis
MSTLVPTSAPPATADAQDAELPLVSVVIPCLNEAENIEACVRAALEAIVRMGVHGEVVVADNNSEDDSARLAESAGARVVVERRRGYGSAYLAGFEASRGRYIVMADADLTYDFEEIPRFVAALEGGAEMVIGDRMDNIQPGAMTWSHRYIGNPILTGLLNLFFSTGISDAHCGMRALRREVLPRLDLRTTGMEFASEMVIRASKEKLKIAEFPIEYHPRGGESKLSTMRDGWRHLRFLLVHSPNHLFIIPGAVLAGLGTLIVIFVGAGLDFFGRAWGVHALIGGALLMIVGTQVLALGLCAHAYGTYFMGERDPWFDRMRARFRLEHGLLLGGAFVVIGLVMGGLILATWIAHGFGSLADEHLAVIAVSVLIVGIQIFFSAFLLSILGLRRNS